MWGIWETEEDVAKGFFLKSKYSSDGDAQAQPQEAEFLVIEIFS